MARSVPHRYVSEGEAVGAVFWFLMAAMVAVVAAVALAVLGSGDGSGGPVTGGLPEAEPDRAHDPLPVDRPLTAADVVAVRLPLAARGYRMAETDDVLDRLAAELAERDARIAALEAELGQVPGPPPLPGPPPPAGPAV